MNWMLMPLRRYADFNGRSRRKEYWLWFLFNMIVVSAITIPLWITVFNAVRTVDAQGGVTYGAPGVRPFGDDDSRFDADRPVTSDPVERTKPNADDWSANPGPDTGDAPEDETDNGSGDASDKVSSRAAPGGPAAVDGGILAFSRSYSFDNQVNVDPVLFFRAFGPVGWTLFGLSMLWALITFIPNLAVAIRRLHDTDRSGWWIFIGAVPLVGAIVLLVFLVTDGTRGSNRFGPDPKPMEADPRWG